MISINRYLMENGHSIYLWISERVPVQEIKDIFGENALAEQTFEVSCDFVSRI